MKYLLFMPAILLAGALSNCGTMQKMPVDEPVSPLQIKSALQDEQTIQKGQKIFEPNCSACHGLRGEGGVGPNLADYFWLHGNRYEDIQKTVAYGIPEKGMISWRDHLTAQEIHAVTIYLMTLEGSNPPNAKIAEGEKMPPAASYYK